MYTSDGNMIKLEIDNKMPEELVDDDDIIDYFLENNTDWTICEWF